MEKKRVAIIGGGASGLTAIKCCLDEQLEPFCFENTDDIGGLWNYSPNRKKNGLASVMKSTVINTSKEMMCFSDFPIDKNFPVFMHNTKVLEYFRLYAKEFDLLWHIRFRTLVTKVSKTEDSKWIVKVEDQRSQEVTEEKFDAVMVCIGHHAEEHMASFPGEETFKGRRIHAHEYTDHCGYEDKRVVVIGIGNSGGDVATELSRIAKQVYLSTRRGSWVLNRIADRGEPLDMQLTTRMQSALSHMLPKGIVNTIAEKQVNDRFDHARYGLKPKHRLLAQHPMVNDELPNRIASGTIIIKPNVEQITETGVKFDDGSCAEDVDVIIYATGYKFSFPFLDLPELQVKNNKLDLYKYMFTTSEENLALIGYVQPLGAVMPISELQCRLATRVFKGIIKLPPVDEMMKDIRCKSAAMATRYTASQRHTIQVDWIPFMDELAELVGCKPDMGALFLSDLRLAKEVLFGPCTPYQYRLHGPGAWKGAREMILTQWERTNCALEARTQHIAQKSPGFVWWILICVILMFVAWFLL